MSTIIINVWYFAPPRPGLWIRHWLACLIIKIV